MRLDERSRRREEDPFTGLLAARYPTHFVVERSRFEVDLNRAREAAIYATPDDAWGLEVWDRPLPVHEVDASLRLYDRFYSELGASLDRAVADHGVFVVYDIHSYNHRREGAAAPPEDPAGNPSVNLGTGSLPALWTGVADAFMHAMAAGGLDVRENVRFTGGHLSTWVHERRGDRGCALAIEFKKEFMDEWSDALVPGAIDHLGTQLDATVNPVLAAARAV